MRLTILAIAALMTVATAAQAQTAPPAPAAAAAAAATPPPAPPPPPYGQPISQAAARRAIDAALAEAARNGWEMAIAVVEPTGELVAFARVDGTQYGSNAVAQQKAWTAARFRRDSKVFADALTAGRLGALSFEGVAAAEGGVLIDVDGKIIGAIGVSGATGAQDAQVARAGAEAAARR